MPSSRCDVLIIGGGAAGLFCAATAAKRGRSVVVVDHAEKLGKKILISGGGRCNFTNRHAGPENYVSANPHFCKSALARYTPDDFIALVESHGIAYHEKTLGQLFCDGSAKQILDMLLAECAASRVEIVRSFRMERLDRLASDSADGARFEVASSARSFRCRSLVVATGGLSIPPAGASDLGYRIARQFGLAVVPTEPGLVPFTLSRESGCAELSGVAVDVRARTADADFREALLFTHAGLSGPAVLQVSSFWRRGAEVVIDLSPDRDLRRTLEEGKAAGSKALASTHLAAHLPKRLAQRWCEAAGGDRPLNQLTPKDVERIAGSFHAWRIVPSGTEGYRKAEVTRGGIDTAELSSQTMESRTVPGLHFIGEVVDVTGWLGGYNFQWAWASAFAAGSAI